MAGSLVRVAIGDASSALAWFRLGRDLRALAASQGRRNPVVAEVGFTDDVVADRDSPQVGDGGGASRKRLSALNCFERAAQLGPTNVAIVSALADALIEAGEGGGGGGALARTSPIVVTLSRPSSRQLSEDGGDEKNETTAVLAECDAADVAMRALELDSSDAAAWLRHAAALRPRRDNAHRTSTAGVSDSPSVDGEIVRSLTQATRLAGGSARAWLELGCEYRRAGMAGKPPAYDDGGEASTLHVHGAAVAIARPGSDLSGLALAVRCLNQATRLDPTSAVSWIELATAYRARGYSHGAQLAALRAVAVAAGAGGVATTASAWVALGASLSPPSNDWTCAGTTAPSPATIENKNTEASTARLVCRDNAEAVPKAKQAEASTLPPLPTATLADGVTRVRCMDCFNKALAIISASASSGNTGNGGPSQTTLARTAAAAWYGIGCALGRDEATLVLGAVQTQTDCFLRCVTLNPRHAQAWNNLGVAMHESDVVRVRGAQLDRVGCLVQAVRVDPAYTQAWLNLGSAMPKGTAVAIDGVQFTDDDCLARGGARTEKPRSRAVGSCAVA